MPSHQCNIRACGVSEEFSIEVWETDDWTGALRFSINVCRGHLAICWEFAGQIEGFVRMSRNTWLVLDHREANIAYNEAREDRSG